ncbi:MAG TPA: DUF2586 family protein, partial [Thermoanaerobaculia bacterium]
MSFGAAVLPSAGVPTSVPAFIGATANAPSDAQPVAIDSLATYEKIFGTTSPGNLHDSIALFYENGGASCYVVSAGTGAITASALIAALNVVAQRRDVTLLVIPDAVLLPSIADFGTVAQAMLQQAGTLGDRFAIRDV